MKPKDNFVNQGTPYPTTSDERQRQRFESGRAENKKQTIAEHARDVLSQLEPVEGMAPAVMWGDCRILDEIAARCTHTNLMQKHPMVRQKRIMDALEKRPDLFEKNYVKMNGGRWEGSTHWRMFELRE